ncbi:Cob yrinic acid-diamide mitochondrial [Fasciola gigantica]|uniref:Corrinoid adenosyltransferase MMAB n=1 Tax=Fasciola gigantica TaxID=46835 RepID=A0A504YZK9_FASGI|nr:Cob yrinic acid-diamide mitochondrial [Fasciola gigantica]
MQRFMSSRLVGRLRAVLQDRLTVLRPAVIGGLNATILSRCYFNKNIWTDQASPVVSLVRTMKIYTGTGDKGTSALFTGERRSKTDVVFDALGTVDELTSVIAMALAQIDLYSNKSVHSGYNLKELCDQLDSIQRRLQALLSSVATPIPSSSGPDASEQRRARFKHVNFPEDASKELEAWIDAMTEVLPPLRQFILPSGGTPGTTLHFARSICRRAERCVVALNVEEVTVETAVITYMNRLSDYLFTAARYVSCALEFPEKPYTVPRPSKK